TQTEELIPKRSAPRRLSHGSYINDSRYADHTDGHGNSSSDSSSGGDLDGTFGGGSSDGGGAGDSW
ncbi:MAG: TPM domain-containing protein, partial [Cyanobacteria bacterium J06636_28]